MAIFEGIGRIGEYAQLKNLRREMKYRIKTGKSLAEAMGAPVQPGKVKSSELQQTREKSDANREMQIRQKLRQGQKLSAVDMRYLKENNPDLYEKVVRIEERREMLARALKRAKTKEEAQRAVAQANISVLSEMQKAASSAMTAGGGMGDALDAPAAHSGDAAPAAGEMQSASPGDVPAQSGGAHTAEHMDTAHGGHAEGNAEKEGFQPGPSTRDQYGNRRVLSREEMDDMLRQAQESGKLTPLDNEKVYLLRALQREWMEFANSEEYKNLPNTALDAAEEEEHGVRRKKRTEAEGTPARALTPSPAEILTAARRYCHTAQSGEAFEARG